MWKVYSPAWCKATGGPYEAYSYTYNGLMLEINYIGMFLGMNGRERTFAVFTNLEISGEGILAA